MPTVEKNKTEQKTEKRFEFGFLDLFLVVGVSVLVVLYAYHQAIVKPLEKEIAASQVYVVDLDAIIDLFKEQAIKRVLAGEKIRPEDVADEVQKYLNVRLSGLPENALVLDARCVVKGGTFVPITVSSDISPEELRHK